VGEDQNAAGAGGVDETDRGDGLTGAGRVFEPEAAVSTVIVGGGLEVDVFVFVALFFSPVLRVFVLFFRGFFEILGRFFFVLIKVGVFVRFGFGKLFDRRELDRVVVGRDLLLGQKLGQCSGEGVDLMGVELGSVAELGRLVADQPFEAEQEREVPAPLKRRFFVPGVDFGQRGIEGAPAGGSGQQGVGALVAQQERFPGKRRGFFDI